MAKDLSLILNNGSLNSAVVTAIAAQKYRPILVFADINANPSSRARAAYDQQVAHFKPYREHSLPMSFLAPLQHSTSAQNVDPRQSGLLAPHLVHLLPLLAATAPFAEHYQASAIYLGLRIGSNIEDLAQATEYTQILNELLQLPCGLTDIEVNAPLLELEPWQVVDLGFQVGAPFDRAWSCNEEGTEPCGVCRGCRNREAAFQQAGKPDPLRVVRRSVTQ